MPARVASERAAPRIVPVSRPPHAVQATASPGSLLSRSPEPAPRLPAAALPGVPVGPVPPDSRAVAVVPARHAHGAGRLVVRVDVERVVRRLGEGGEPGVPGLRHRVVVLTERPQHSRVGRLVARHGRPLDLAERALPEGEVPADVLGDDLDVDPALVAGAPGFDLLAALHHDRVAAVGRLEQVEGEGTKGDHVIEGGVDLHPPTGLPVEARAVDGHAEHGERLAVAVDLEIRVGGQVARDRHSGLVAHRCVTPLSSGSRWLRC